MGFFDALFGTAAAATPSAPADVTPDTGPIPAMAVAPASSRAITSTMTQEELKLRRINLVESSKLGRPFHETLMLILLRFWLVLGPIAFVALTTSEVAYILTQLVPAGDTSDYIIWAGALFIDLAMMFTTFG